MKPILLMLMLIALAGVSVAAVRGSKWERAGAPPGPLQTTVGMGAGNLSPEKLNGATTPAVYEPTLMLLYSQPQVLKRQVSGAH